MTWKRILQLDQLRLKVEEQAVTLQRKEVALQEARDGYETAQLLIACYKEQGDQGATEETDENCRFNRERRRTDEQIES